MMQIVELQSEKLRSAVRAFMCQITGCSEKKVYTILQSSYEGVGDVVLDFLVVLRWIYLSRILLYLLFFSGSDPFFLQVVSPLVVSPIVFSVDISYIVS